MSYIFVFFWRQIIYILWNVIWDYKIFLQNSKNIKYNYNYFFKINFILNIIV